MSAPVQYCGNLSPKHAARNCRECKRIRMAIYRGKTKQEALASDTAKQPVCRSCRMRWTVNPSAITHLYNPINLTPSQVQWLENAARVFDQEADEPWSAEEFVAWLKPDVIGMRVEIPEAAGLSRKAGGHSPRINSADPLPYYDRKEVA